ncbi:hypothetical protein ABCX18_00270 [Chlamydia trachomatis]|uniref:Uncharacterized protein n=1 Tax=Chlamydia trachomatis TaxID=813 RepID=K0GGE8_CHLTH|nr:hypothetical protein [Chlamydia trachomatis]AFU23651.1 hypothetical protein CT050 [Chlamydia trachomatis]AGT64840.1 hypothetical protein O169_00270 [Chlamydia trachomatis]AGT67625.1 hypothetical protein O173_00270 [Chlamydia trachomatis F/11-96]AGT69479.1 hypothetical protein O176_00270 [Chlamydia trachomatis]AKR40211.1 hypothetical protein FCS84708_00265 [Chlamydia trachomatis]
MNDTKNNISSSFWNPNKVVTKVLLKVSETGIESTPGIVKHNQPITQSENPTDPTDAVTFKYLKENYTKENDPNPGFLPTTGGTMTGDIDMQGNNVTDIVMYTNGQQNPTDDSAVTIGYLNEKADEIKSNDQITTAVAGLSNINSQISTLHQLLGIAEDPDTVTNPDLLKTSGGTVYEDIDMSSNTVSDLGTPTNKDTKSAINVEFVQAKITSPQMAFLKNNDTNLSNITVSEYFNWLQAPTQAPTPDPTPTTPDNSNTPNNPPSPSNGASPFIRELAATTTGSTDTEITPAAEGTDLPNTTFSEKSPLWEEFFSFSDSSRSEMVIQKTGILTFSMQGTWNHPNNTTPTSTDPISLELTVTPPKTDTTPESPPSSLKETTPEATSSPATNGPTTASITKTFSRKYNLSATPSPTPTTPTTPDPITKKFLLDSGQSCTLQIPVQATGSVLQLKYVNPNNNSSGGSSGSEGDSQPEESPTSSSGTNNAPASQSSRIQIRYASTTTTDSGSTTENPVKAQADESTPPETTPTGITLTSFSWSLVLTSGEITKATSTPSTPSQP